ncbi:DNA-deoxyinosine glycosylase [Paenibacillus sp. HB172176]|uniref:DNA-deoxyinosine glycosylase n=1 Tax=Paenibacillus sp. HB172176 TaxID=2493690 RepID=UPI00143AA4FE|nr:DNA-deoxyinosine glycosylase [Paenibacillus sp. HB172176]
MRIHSFPPVVDERARVLIAGTAPSVKSLEHRQFYGHKQNYFWRIVYGLFGEGGGDANARIHQPPPESYEERVAFLQKHRLALWDVIASCEREGSLDANIRDESANDIPGLLRRYPGIRCIAFNGSKAWETFRKVHGTEKVFPGISLLKLPSTSPIPTKHMRSLEDRLAAWKVIVPYAERS